MKIKRRFLLLLILSLLCLAYIIISKYTDVYFTAISGAVYELLWLPVLILIPGIIILSAFYIFRNKYYKFILPALISCLNIYFIFF